MADDTAALVLSLEARFDKFEKSMKDAAGVVDKQTKAIEDRFDAMTKVIGDKLGSIQGTLIAQTGTLGRALASLGPFGLAAALGIGALALAWEKAAEMAEKYGDRAKELRSTALITGLSATQIVALQALGRQFGVASEDTTNFVERFTAKMDEARRADGELFEAVQRIDRGLALELASSKNEAEALDVLARAYKKASEEGNKFAATRLTIAAGGRGGIAAGPLLGALANSGGVAGITEGKADIDATVDRVAKLKIEIEETKKLADKIWAGMFSEAVLEKQRQSANLMLQIAESARALKEADDATHLSWIDKFIAFQARGGDPDAQVAAITKGIAESDLLRRRAEESIRTQLQQGKRSDLRQFSDWMEDDTKATKKNTEAKDQNTLSATARFNLLQQSISVLGNAATLEEQRAVKEAQIDALLEKHKITQQESTRALTEFNRAQSEQIIATRERLGIATEQEIFDAKMIDILRQLDKGEISYAQSITARGIAQKEARQKFEDQQARVSQFPQLTRLTQDSMNLSKTLDSFAVRSIDTLADSLVSAANGTKTLSDAFRDMATSILNDIAKIAIKAALLQTLNLLVPGLGTATGTVIPKMAGGPVSGGGSFLVGEAGPELFTPSQSGFITPNSALRGGSGSSPINFGGISVDARGAAPGVSNEVIARLRAEMPGIAVSAVAQAQRYGTLRPR